MLRTLMLLCFSLISVNALAQQHTPVSEPTPILDTVTNDLIDRQSNTASSLVEEADKLSTNPTLLDSIERGREAIKASPFDLRSYLNEIDENPALKNNPQFLDDILNNGNRILSTPEQSASSSNPVILVSFGMPEPLLLALLEEAQLTGALVFLRGLHNDHMSDTTVKIAEYAKSREFAIGIDPTLFDRFDVSSVPTFILPLEPIEPCTDAGCPTPLFIKASGGTSLAYFLRLVERTGESTEQTVAASWLEKYDE